VAAPAADRLPVRLAPIPRAMARLMRVSDFDLLIVPRLGGAAEGDWPNRWRSKLSTARFVLPVDPRDTRREAWTGAVGEAVREAKRPALFVGHGLGAAAIVQAADALGEADIRGAFLVAPPDAATLEKLASGWAPSRARLPWPSLVVASRSDPSGAYDAVAALASDWGADLIDAGEAGGLDAASGHGPWPEGLMRLAGFIKRIG
jgi:predicted alpha/beta hydrolase family esterase